MAASFINNGPVKITVGSPHGPTYNMLASDFSLDARPNGLSRLHADIVNWQTVNSGEQATVTATLMEYQPMATAPEGLPMTSGSSIDWDSCKQCGNRIPLNHTTVAVIGTVGNQNNYCAKCAQYTRKGGFESHTSWMKKMLGFKADTPDGIVADMLEEKGLIDLAAALRKSNG